MTFSKQDRFLNLSILIFGVMIAVISGISAYLFERWLRIVSIVNLVFCLGIAGLTVPAIVNSDKAILKDTSLRIVVGVFTLLQVIFLAIVIYSVDKMPADEFSLKKSSKTNKKGSKVKRQASDSSVKSSDGDDEGEEADENGKSSSTSSITTDEGYNSEGDDDEGTPVEPESENQEKDTEDSEQHIEKPNTLEIAGGDAPSTENEEGAPSAPPLKPVTNIAGDNKAPAPKKLKSALQSQKTFRTEMKEAFDARQLKEKNADTKAIATSEQKKNKTGGISNPASKQTLSPQKSIHSLLQEGLVRIKKDSYGASQLNLDCQKKDEEEEEQEYEFD